MTDTPFDSFLVEIGFKKPDEAAARAAVDTVIKVEAEITAAQSAEMDKRIAAEMAGMDKHVAIERKGTSLRLQMLDELVSITNAVEAMRADQSEKIEQERADKVEAIRKVESDAINKREAEDLKKALARRDALLKSTRELALGMAGVFTGLAAGITGAATGLLWATDRAAKGFERLAYAGQMSGSSAAGLSRVGYAASQSGTTAEDAQGSVNAFGENLKKLPALEGILKSMGIATREANGQLRDSSALMVEYIDHLKELPQLQREARTGVWGISDTTTRAVLRDGYHAFEREHDRIQSAVDADPNAAAQGALGFEQAIRRDFEIIGAIKTRVETSLFEIIKPRLDDVAKWVLDHGDAISNVVTSISKGLTDLATAFVKSDVVQSALSGLGDELERLAKYVGSDAFKKDVSGFVDDVEAMARAIRSALEWIGVLPSRAGAAVVPTPEGTDRGSADGGGEASLHNRRSHGARQNVDDDHVARVRGQENSFDAVSPTGAHTPLKDLIATHETGGTGAAGYDTVYGHAEQPGSKMAALAPPKPISQMTIGEVLAYQREMKPRAGSAAFPVGRAQWTESTLRGLTAGMGKSTVFTPEVQERLFDRSIAGRMGQGVNGFRNEWASLGGVDDSTIGNAIEGHRKAMASSAGTLGGNGTYPDWMDDRSKRELAGVNADLAKDLLAAAKATGMRFKVAQGLRTQEEAKANAQSGRGVVNSQHRWGAAADIHLLGENGNVTYDRNAYQQFAGAFENHSRANGGNARWLGNVGGRWASDIVHFDQGIGYGQSHPRTPYGTDGPTKDDIAEGNRMAFASPANPFLGGHPNKVSATDDSAAKTDKSLDPTHVPPSVPMAPRTIQDHTDRDVPSKVSITDDSASKLGKHFASSFFGGSSTLSGNSLLDIHNWWQEYAERHGKEVVHPGLNFKTHPLGIAPSLHQSYDNSRKRGDTNINHSPTFHIHGGDAKQGLDAARMVADRGPRDLVRNLRAVEQ